MAGYTYKGNGFVIENNIHKGRKVSAPQVNGQIGQYILNCLERNPDHVSQIEPDTNRTTTYEEMRDKSIRCALWLNQQNVNKGDVVGLCSNLQLDNYVPILATFYVGAVYNPWDPEISLKTARRLIHLIQPKIMFCIENVIETLEEAANLEGLAVKFVIIGNRLGKSKKYESLDDICNSQKVKDVDAFKPKVITNLQDPALIMFSSGSTGLPKGVVHSYESVLYNYLLAYPYPVKNCVNLWYSTPFWLTNTLFTITSILQDCVRILHKKFDPEGTMQLIDNYKINWCMLSPTQLNYINKSGILSSKKFSADSLKRIAVGGSKVNKDTLTHFKTYLPNAPVASGFGMTEAGCALCHQTPDSKIIDSIGFVATNAEIKVVDESGHSLGPNQPGEMLVKAAVMMTGYYKNPEETRKAIDEEGWLHTGDKVLFNEEGELQYIERIKFLIKCQNHQISPMELEDLLLTHPGVLEVAVVPLPHEIDGERPLAFVKTKEGVNVTEDELIKLSYDLGRNKRLSGGVIFLATMPHTPSGKISKNELKVLLQKLIDAKQIDNMSNGK